MDAIRKSNVKPDLPLAALELFEVAGRAQNLTRAAEIAGLSQPAFSHRIRDLERTLGVTLFHREHRGVTLTRAGEDLLAVCTRSLGDLRAALERIRAGPGSKVLVATDFGFSSYWIMPRLPAMRRATGDIELNLVAAQHPTAPSLRDIDIHIFLTSDLSESRTRRLLFEEAAVPVASPDYLAKARTIEKPSDLSQHPLLHLAAPDGAPWMTWQQWFAGYGLDYEPQATGTVLSNYMLVVQAALSGRGLCLGWKHLVDDLIAEGTLVPAFDQDIKSGRAYCIELLGHRSGDAAQRIFEEIVAAAVVGD